MILIRLLLLPFSALYFMIFWLKNLLYDLGIIKIFRAPVPVICIGNLSVGGTGKTPVLQLISEYLINENYKISIISRGYKRNSSGSLEVNKIDADLFGDEPVMLKKNLNTNVYVSENRIEVFNKYLNENKPDFVMLDDGFQNRRLYKDYSVLIVDRTKRNILEKLILPAGNLRESLSALKKADAVINNFKFEEPAIISDLIHPNMYDCRYILEGFCKVSDDSFVPSENIKNEISAFCGIGSPDSFFALLKNSGFILKIKEVFFDHHRYTENELNKILKTAGELKLETVITTEKDAVRIKDMLSVINNSDKINLYYAKISARIENIEKLIEDIIKKVKKDDL